MTKTKKNPFGLFLRGLAMGAADVELPTGPAVRPTRGEVGVDEKVF